MIKKMLAMLVAISCAFGAWADTHLSGTDFSALNVGSFVLGLDDEGNDTGTNYWYNGDTSDFEGSIVTDGVGKFLDFESNITNPLYRTINNCYEAESISELPKRSIGTGLFIDTHVQFTPYLVNENHPAPEALSTDDKLIVWVRETEVDGDANITNLIVTAGYYDAFNAVSASNYVVRLSAAQVSELCSNTNRLTIKSFSRITDKANGPVGFVIYLNEQPIEYDADAFAVGCTYVDDLAATPGSYYEYGHHMLFPSLMGDLANYDKLIGVGYAGMGKIGDVIFDDKTTDFPPFAADANDFRVVPGDGVESYVYNNVEYTTEQAFSVPATVATVTISNVQYATGWQHKEGTWYNGTTIVANEYDAVTDTDYGTFVLANGATLNIAGFQANYTVGGEPYQTLFGGSVTEPTGAFAAAKNGGTIVLNSDIIIAEGVNEQIVVGEGDELTIDLNGHTIQGTAADGTIVNEGGTLTIVDNSVGQTGKVLGCLVANPDYDSEDPDSEPLIDNEQALLITEEAVATTLAAGTYEFIIKDELNDSLVISNGAYLCVNEDEPGEQPTSFYLVGSLATGATYIWSQDTDTGLWYAIVTSGSAPTTYPVTFSTNSVPVAEYTTNITAGATLPDGAIPAFTGGAWDVDPTNAVINAATNFNYTIETSYTLTYVSDHGTVPDGVVYTASTLDFALAAAPTADGWQFNGWLIGSNVFDAGDSFVVADHLEDTTATAVWAPISYTLTYVTDKGTAPDAVSYTVESNNFALAAAPVTSEVGIEFVGWVIGAVTNNAEATFVVADHLENTTATAAWTALVAPPKFPQSDTAGTEYADRDGTAAKPFVIRNVDDLVTLKEAVADGEITTESFEVVSNITGVTDWVGIGTETAMFEGTLNGNGKTINIAFAPGKYNGLFCFIRNATISNLTVNVTDITVSGSTGAAAFVGKAYGANVLTAVKATGSLGTSGNRISHNAGGLVVYLLGPSGVITYNNCTNAMDVYSSGTKLGGFLGWASGGASVVINNGVNLGNLSSTNTDNSGDNGVGGFIGWDYNDAISTTFNGAISLGTVEMGTGNAGSFYGERSGTLSGTTGVIQGLANQKPVGASGVQAHAFDWATVDGNVATFVTPVTTVGSTVTYKAMQPASDAFTLTADDASLTIITNLCAYTGTVTVDATLTAQGYELVTTADANGVTFTAGSSDPWAPTAETDEAAAAKIADLFPGTEVAANVTTYAMYTNLVDYIKGVTSQSEVPGDITDAQAPWLWKSYILGANPLFVTNAVVTITDVNAAATAGEWDFIVKVTEGELTTAHSVAAAKVAALVKVTDSLSPASWSEPDPEDVHADLAPLLGTNLIKVTVDFGTDTSGFMKVSE